MRLNDDQAMRLGRSMEQLYLDNGMDEDDKAGYAWDEIKSFMRKPRPLKVAIASK